MVVAGRQGVAKHGEVETFVAKSNDLVQNNAPGKLNAASGRNLDAVWRNSGIVAQCHQYRDIHHRAGGSGVEGESQSAICLRSPQGCATNDQPLLCIEGKVHNTIAVSFGILPVYTIANLWA